MSTIGSFERCSDIRHARIEMQKGSGPGGFSKDWDLASVKPSFGLASQASHPWHRAVVLWEIDTESRLEK